jgi:hypothetical protein
VLWITVLLAAIGIEAWMARRRRIAAIAP